MTNMMAPDPKECERAMALSPAAQRWRAVDSAFQAAIACERSRRDLIVAEACGQDADVRREVESLLDAHDRAADDFLERPAAASFAAALTSPRSARRSVPSPAPERRRAVSARAALFMAGAMLTIGLVGGWQLAGSASAVARLTSSASELLRPPANADVDAMWPSAADGALALTVVDRAGRSAGRGTIAANRPWTPRFSPDGRRLAYGAFGPERSSSDVWVTDLDAGTTRRLTNDSRDNNDPQWNADGRTLAYSASAAGGKDVLMQAADGGAATVIVARDGTQFPSDWLRDGSALLVTHANGSSNDILAQPLDGSAAWPYAATSANETAARASPDGKWVAYTSDESGRVEVYLDSYPRPGKRIAISQDGGMHPVWRGDGRELFYWSNDALIAVQIGMPPDGSPPAIERRTLLFRAPYQVGLNTMYDVSPDGRSFVIVRNGDAMR
jgi:hypothetical protein